MVNLAFHALAIDEHRRPFEASVWRRNKFKDSGVILEQVWFPGAHGDIGGGYLSDQQRNQAQNRGLDDLPLDWMIKRLWSHVPDFPISDRAWIGLPERATLGAQHDSRTALYKLYRKAVRSIGNRPLQSPLLPTRDVAVGYDPNSKTVNESIHIKAIQQLAKHAEEPTDFDMPVNLVACLPDLGWLYSSRGPKKAAPDTLRVTAMDGQVVEPGSELAPHIFSELRATWEKVSRRSRAMERLGWTSRSPSVPAL